MIASDSVHLVSSDTNERYLAYHFIHLSSVAKDQPDIFVTYFHYQETQGLSNLVISCDLLALMEFLTDLPKNRTEQLITCRGC